MLKKIFLSCLMLPLLINVNGKQQQNETELISNTSQKQLTVEEIEKQYQRYTINDQVFKTYDFFKNVLETTVKESQNEPILLKKCQQLKKYWKQQYVFTINNKFGIGCCLLLIIFVLTTIFGIKKNFEIIFGNFNYYRTYKNLACCFDRCVNDKIIYDSSLNGNALKKKYKSFCQNKYYYQSHCKEIIEDSIEKLQNERLDLSFSCRFNDETKKLLDNFSDEIRKYDFWLRFQKITIINYTENEIYGSIVIFSKNERNYLNVDKIDAMINKNISKNNINEEEEVRKKIIEEESNKIAEKIISNDLEQKRLSIIDKIIERISTTYKDKESINRISEYLLKLLSCIYSSIIRNNYNNDNDYNNNNDDDDDDERKNFRKKQLFIAFYTYLFPSNSNEKHYSFGQKIKPNYKINNDNYVFQERYDEINELKNSLTYFILLFFLRLISTLIAHFLFPIFPEIVNINRNLKSKFGEDIDTLIINDYVYTKYHDFFKINDGFVINYNGNNYYRLQHVISYPTMYGKEFMVFFFVDFFNMFYFLTVFFKMSEMNFFSSIIINKITFYLNLVIMTIFYLFLVIYSFHPYWQRKLQNFYYHFYNKYLSWLPQSKYLIIN